MFIEHGQFSETFDQERALRVFNGSLSWRKRHNTYGNDKHKNAKTNNLL